MSKSAIKIDSIEAIPVVVPWRRTYATAYGPYPNERVIVLIKSSDGAVGVAEGQTDPVHYGESAATVVATIQLLTPVLLGKDALTVRARLRDMDEVVQGQKQAKAAVEVALMDLVGKHLRLPVATLLGAELPEAIPLAWPVGLAEPEAMADDARSAVEQGYKSVKVKIGRSNPQDDLRAIKLIREAVGDDVAVRVDANGYCAGRLQLLKALETYDLELIEQPTLNAAEMKHFRHHLSTPLLADEMVQSPADAVEVVRAGLADIIKIQVRHQGGILRARDVAVIATAAGLQIYSDGPIETSLGTAASAHLVASALPLGWRYRPLLGMGIDLFSENFSTEPLKIRNGELLMPQGPGFGVSLDERTARKLKM